MGMHKFLALIWATGLWGSSMLQADDGDLDKAINKAVEILEKYANEGVVPADDVAVLRVQPLAAMGTPVQLVSHFGGKPGYEAAVHELEDALYGAVA